MVIGSKIIFEKHLPSTNTYAIKLLASERPPEGTIIRTDFQSAGRGQPGNKWESEEGKNLLFSIVLYPNQISPGDQFIVSMTVSLGILDFVGAHASCSTIKWPNDIYVKDDKIAGILIESSTMGNRLQHMIAGIGLNINQDEFHSNARNPISLKQVTGNEYNLDSCLDELCYTIDERYNRLKKGESANLVSEYHSVLYRSHEWTEFVDETGVFTGMIKKVGSDGRITIEKESGGIKHYYFKEVEFML